MVRISLRYSDCRSQGDSGGPLMKLQAPLDNPGDPRMYITSVLSGSIEAFYLFDEFDKGTSQEGVPMFFEPFTCESPVFHQATHAPY